MNRLWSYIVILAFTLPLVHADTTFFEGEIDEETFIFDNVPSTSDDGAGGGTGVPANLTDGDVLVLVEGKNQTATIQEEPVEFPEEPLVNLPETIGLIATALVIVRNFYAND